MKKIVIALASLISVNVYAASYGEAGCGLGSVVMGKDGNQILSATTNATSYTQIFGITSGTSNCTEDGAVRSSRHVPMYIEVNRLALAKDAARGEGETLAGLAQLMGCQEQNLGQTLKSNYNEIFVNTSMEATKIRTGIESAIEKNPAQTCGAVAKN